MIFPFPCVQPCSILVSKWTASMRVWIVTTAGRGGRIISGDIAAIGWRRSKAVINRRCSPGLHAGRPATGFWDSPFWVPRESRAAGAARE